MYIKILFNVIAGVFLCFLLFLPFCSYSILDPELFSLSNSGTVVVREAVESNTRTPIPPLLKKSGMTEEQTRKSC